MRIGIDARMFGPEQGGLGRYVEQLLKHLLVLDTPHIWVVLVRDDAQAQAVREFGNQNLEVVMADMAWYSLAEQMRLPGLLNSLRLDLVHFPHWNVPLLYRGRFVVTVHDLIMYHYPRPEATTLGPLTYWLKDKLARVVVRQAVRRARHILTTSEFTRQDIHKTLGVPLDKMTVTYQAPFGDSRVNPDKVGKESSSARLYVLYVGSAYPHKNVEGLVAAWEKFVEKYGAAYELVIVGKPSVFYARVEKMLAQNQVPNVRRVESATDTELLAWYAGARLYVFPSLYEGFGLPPLEAMQAGVPVVSSNLSCLPEVLGEAALYVDPTDPAALADAMYQGLTNEEIRYELRQAAKLELTRYSWADLAQKTLAVYEQFRP